MDHNGQMKKKQMLKLKLEDMEEKTNKNITERKH